jgi:hypothetical protein
MWCECCVRDNAIECSDGTFWPEDHVVTSGEGEYLSPDQIEDDYFYCELSDDYWKHEDAVSLADGDSVSIQGIQQYNKSSSSYGEFIYDRENDEYFHQEAIESKEASSNE